jgi:hypothetical protein
MNDAAQIRRCSGALLANHPRSWPTFLSSPPSRRPNLTISKREAVRRVRADDSARREDDVINVTQTKQKTQPHSNRELEALFSNHHRSTHHLNLKISNREALRLEINVTQTKQTAQPHSNREKEALFSNRVRAVSRLRDCGEIDSARRYIDRSTRHLNLKNSNREKSHVLQIAINPPASTTRNCSQLNSQIPNFRPPKKAKSIKNHPQSLFRLECTSTVYFQQLTRNLNEPMFRLEHNIFTIPESRLPVAQPLLAVSVLATPRGTLLDPGRNTNLRSATHAYSIDERRWR